MLKKTIIFENLEGQKVSDDFYFHLNKAEATRVMAGLWGASGQTIEDAITSAKFEVPIDKLLEIITTAYGKKDADGVTFIKTPELTARFTGTDAYGELFEELISDPNKFLEFLKGVLPAGMAPDSLDIKDVKLPGAQPVAAVEEQIQQMAAPAPPAYPTAGVAEAPQQGFTIPPPATP